MQQANLLGKPVITATQMLESMISNSRPTRAEVSDAINAIIDGTGCLMLLGESAMGMYPVTSVKMLAKISSTIEPNLRKFRVQDIMKETNKEGPLNLRDIIAQSVDTTQKSIL